MSALLEICLKDVKADAVEVKVGQNHENLNQGEIVHDEPSRARWQKKRKDRTSQDVSKEVCRVLVWARQDTKTAEAAAWQEGTRRPGRRSNNWTHRAD